MKVSLENRLPWAFLAYGLFAGMGMAAVQETQAPNTRTAQILAKLVPLPANVPRSIMNPYYAHPAWKLWAVDPDPVAIDKPHFKGLFQPQPAGGRKYPIWGLKGGVGAVIMQPLRQSPWSGSWDDAYMSLDNHHTRLRQPKSQFIDAGKMPLFSDVETLLQLGVNFTSQSYADRGRAIVDDVINNLNMERHFFFANCIRATPAHNSYRDEKPDQASDLYDGLFAHCYQSVGQSGSEMHALYKMMLAGASMPRSTKNLLKRHGAYAIALLTIFKAALPYADAQGRPLPFAHELRHRPAYSSHGTPEHVHYCPANAHYHGYDDQGHLAGMMAMARELSAAPPVAIAKLRGFRILQADAVITNPAELAQRIKCHTLTNTRIWGEKGETLDILVDLNGSYDLQQRPLTFRCQALYPNQSNISIKQEATGLFRISVTYDPNLPKGRLPVICTAYNGLSLPSNPTFINFYWPDANEQYDYFPAGTLSEDGKRKLKALGLKRLPVNVNLRPVVDFGLIGDAVRCRPGETISIDLKATDPEGFPVTVYRRAGQMGTIDQGRFTVQIPATDRDKIYRVHFIFSDGTGGYTGKQVKLLVSKEPASLPKPWGLTTLGPLPRVVQVDYDNDTVTFGPQALDRQAESMQGTFLLQPVAETMDLMCRIPPTSARTNIGLMITNTLDGYSRRAGIGLFQGKIAGIIKTGEQARTSQTTPWPARHADKSVIYRLTWRNAQIAGYISTDPGIWEQVMVGDIKLYRECYAGLIYRGDPWTSGICHWLGAASAPLPVVTTPGQEPDAQARYVSPLVVSLSIAGQDMTLRYTLDGSQPTGQSPVYQEPLKLRGPGQQELRVTPFRGDTAQETLVTRFHLKRR